METIKFSTCSVKSNHLHAFFHMHTSDFKFYMDYEWAGTVEVISEGVVRGVKRVVKEKTIKRGLYNI